MTVKPKLYKSKLKANIAHLPLQIHQWQRGKQWEKAERGISILKQSIEQLAKLEAKDARRG